MFDITAVPDYIITFHAGELKEVIEDYFRDPVHQKEFKKWRKERNRIRKSESCTGATEKE